MILDTARRTLLTWVSVTSLTLATSATAGEQTKVDLLVHSGHIYTLDQTGTRAGTMAISQGKVLAVGGPELRDAYHSDQELDLEGRTILPGFNDTHVHISGKPRHYIDLTKVGSVAEIRSLVSAKAAELEPGSWITGYGWSEDELAERRRPLIDDLDSAAPENPVMLTRAGAHSAVVSSRAMALAGIEPNTPDPEGGAIEKDTAGKLNGIIRERHDQLIGALIPPAPKAELRASLTVELRKLFALGITSITEAMTSVEEYAQWEKVYAEHSGTLPRATVQLSYAGQQAMATFGKKTGDGNEHLKVGPIKIFADGGFTGPAAYTKQPYRHDSTYRGHLNMPEQDLRNLIFAAHTDGWQLGIHAIGDAAIELVVEILAQALQAHPRQDHRHYLNHFTVMPSIKTMRTMANLGIAITQQPNFTYTLEGRYRTYLDGERLQHNNPIATPMSHGVHVAISSDILPLGPWTGIYAATTRRGMSGQVYGEQEIITREQALRAYTHLGAWLNRDEQHRGRLTPGMWADFIVLDEDPLSIDDDSLLNLQARATYLGGSRVWQRDTAKVR